MINNTCELHKIQRNYFDVNLFSKLCRLFLLQTYFLFIKKDFYVLYTRTQGTVSDKQKFLRIVFCRCADEAFPLKKTLKNISNIWQHRNTEVLVTASWQQILYYSY